MNMGSAAWFVAFAFVALLAVGLGLYVRRRRAVARALGDREVVRELVGLDLDEMPWLRLGLVAAAGLALAGSLLGSPFTTGRPTPRGPVVLLLDASGSMLAEDAGGRRLDAERAFARSLVEALPETPIGIVAFAGRAFSLTPPTRDRGAIEMYLDALDPTTVTQTGSALGAALRQGLGLLGASGDPAGATIVLIGDGDETDDPEAALEAAGLARRSRVVVHTIGVGGEEGAPVPALDPATGEVAGYLVDEAGEPVMSRRADDLLQGIADRGRGTYMLADEGGATVTRLAERIRRGDGGEREIPSEGEVPLHIWLALVALVLLIAEPAMARREVAR